MGTACAGGAGKVHGELPGVLVHASAAWNGHGGLEPQFQNAPLSAQKCLRANKALMGIKA